MRKVFYLVVFLLIAGSFVSLWGESDQKLESLDSDEIYAILQKSAKWQMDNPGHHSDRTWTKGALFAGMVEWSRISDSDVEEWLLQRFEKSRWRLGRGLSPYHADDHAVGWSYLEMYRKFTDEKMKADVQKRFDWILDHPSQADLKVSISSWNRWCWCDALFMSPPVWINLYEITGDQRYLEFGNREWWATSDYLYDKQQKLFFRDSRYFKIKEDNGEDVFWGRGNGWVLGALPRMLKYLPLDHPDRSRYIELYQKMAQRVIELQGEDGFWRASLLDPDSYPSPETSATAFFCYSLLTGVRNGWLSDPELKEKAIQAGLKSWNSMQLALHSNGKLGWIQPIGKNPKKVTRNMTEVYGVGGFLLAGTELYHIVKKNEVE